MSRVDLNDISDNRKFQDLAFLVDRDDFQADLTKLKRDFAKLSAPYGLEKFEDYFKGADQIDLAIKLVLKYKYPHGFGKAIIAAANKNKITNEDVINCYVAVHKQGLILPDERIPYYPQKNEILISIYPYSLNSKLDKVLDEIKTILENSKYDNTLPQNHALNKKPINQIRSQRELYWYKKASHKGYGSLAKEFKLPSKTVINRIKAYADILKEVY